MELQNLGVYPAGPALVQFFLTVSPFLLFGMALCNLLFDFDLTWGTIRKQPCILEETLDF